MEGKNLCMLSAEGGRSATRSGIALLQLVLRAVALAPT